MDTEKMIRQTMATTTHTAPGPGRGDGTGEGAPTTDELHSLLLRVRPHIMGILSAVEDTAGVHQSVQCPQCQHNFKVRGNKAAVRDVRR